MTVATDNWDTERNQRIAAAKVKFDAVAPMLRFGGRYRTTLGRRLGGAFDAVTGWRMANNQRQYTGDDDSIAIAARVTCMTVADQIVAAAGPDHDATTVAWVAAGLRCPVQPFCTGCAACQSVTSPLRPSEPLPRGPFD